MKKILLVLGLLLVPAMLDAQTKDSLISSRVDSVQVMVPAWAKTYTNTYLRVSTVQPVGKLTVSPKTASAVVSGAGVQFTASGPATWTATGGPVTAAGLYWPGKTAGRYLVIAQSGALADTAIVTITGTVTLPPVDTTKLPPATGGAGNIANLTFESGGFEGLTDGGGGNPVNVSIATSGCYSGSHCLDFDLNGKGAGSAYLDLGGTRTDVWASFAVKIVTRPGTGPVFTQKMVVFRNLGNGQNQLGEMNQESDHFFWSWLFTFSGPNYPLSSLPKNDPDLGKWIPMRVHFDAKSTPGTVLTVYRRGVDGTIAVQTLTTGNRPPTSLTTMMFGGPNNDGGPSHFVFDNIHIGTVDPGWP